MPRQTDDNKRPAASSRAGRSPGRGSEPAAKDKPTITGARSELGRLLAAHTVAGQVHFNLAGQHANSMLHDGHAWAGFAEAARAGARRALRSDADLLVHASFSFIRGDAPNDPLLSVAQAIEECEQIVLAGAIPCVVVRLGYLYGPQSKDLLGYRKAFRLGRPYWSGPKRSLQDHLHQHDAVAALIAAARPKNAGKILYATDGKPLPFIKLMDGFAHRVGRPHPLHAPLLTAPLMRLVVCKEHMQQVALAMPAKPPAPMVPGWQPVFADYRQGLDQLIDEWAVGN